MRSGTLFIEVGTCSAVQYIFSRLHCGPVYLLRTFYFNHERASAMVAVSSFRPFTVRFVVRFSLVSGGPSKVFVLLLNVYFWTSHSSNRNRQSYKFVVRRTGAFGAPAESRQRGARTTTEARPPPSDPRERHSTRGRGNEDRGHMAPSAGTADVHRRPAEHAFSP